MLKFNTVEVGIALRVVVNFQTQDIPIFGQGADFMKALGCTSKVVGVTVDYIGNTVVADTAAVATLLITGFNTTGGAQTITCTTMKPRGFQATGVIQGEAVVSQLYTHISSDGTTNPITFG